MPTRYLFVFAQAHVDFRIPELVSIAELNCFNIIFSDIPEERDPTRPFMILSLEEDEHARILARRCILVKSIYQFYARGSSYEEMHERNRDVRSQWSQYIPDTSFKFVIDGYNRSITQSRQREIINGFSYMAMLGKIDMNNPQIMFGCFEEHSRRTSKDPALLQVYFGRLVCHIVLVGVRRSNEDGIEIEEGSARSLIKRFDVKRREYYGNTSMEAEISLLMANQTLASPGKLIYDPFVGTGSMIYTTAHFGAQVFGSDIDGRQMRGKDKQPGIIRAATQYGIASRIVDLCTFDVTNNPWRCGELFDAIVTDPPYGVRAGAKRLGRKKERQVPQRSTCPQPNDAPYIHPTKPYEFSNLASDLVVLARYMLKPGGRLVFFLPTVTDEYDQLDIDSTLCEGMTVVANSLQDFGSWGRRLVTIRKTTTAKFPVPSFDADCTEIGHVPAHKGFRDKFFQGFRKDAQDTIEAKS